MKNKPAKSTTTLNQRCRGSIYRTLQLGLDKSSPYASNFNQKVYSEVSKIPKGKVCSYKDIATRIGKPKAYRAVANALSKNPFIGKVPCHRVIKSDGTIGGFSRGVVMKKRMLQSEGLTIKGNTVIM